MSWLLDLPGIVLQGNARSCSESNLKRFRNVKTPGNQVISLGAAQNAAKPAQQGSKTMQAIRTAGVLTRSMMLWMESRKKWKWLFAINNKVWLNLVDPHDGHDERWEVPIC
jgi:hypothetical protein